MDDINLNANAESVERGSINPLREDDPRPPREKISDFSDWLLRRYFISNWDNEFVERLEMILKRDKDGNLIPEGKAFRNERRGVCISAISQDGKTAMASQVLKRLFKDSFTEFACGEKIVYCSLGWEASVKSVSEALCRATGYNEFPTRMTRPEACELAVRRLRLRGITMIIIDEAHNLSDPKDVINRFLKTLAQAGGGFCVILIGTPKMREFLYEDSRNLELAERYLDLPLKPFSRHETIGLINIALKEISKDADIRLAASIRRDPYFADRIYDGLRGSFGRCMFLIVSAVIRAFECGSDTVEADDFRRIFDLKYLHFNAENPFAQSDWADRVEAATLTGAGSSSVFFDDEIAPAPKKKRGRPRKNAGTAQ